MTRPIQSSLYNKATLFGKKCGHIREAAFGEREKYMIAFIVVAAKTYGLIREGGLC